ncbi:MAG: DUF2853 family protein [Saprospiraceae bacterium]
MIRSIDINTPDIAFNDSELKINIELLTSIARSLGPSIYSEKNSFIDTNNTIEIENIKKKFIHLKLGVKDESMVTNAIEFALELIGKKPSRNLRLLFYYLLVVFLKKEYIYIAKNSNSNVDDSLLKFGEEIIKNQKDIDLDIKNILDNNFSKLL